MRVFWPVLRCIFLRLTRPIVEPQYILHFLLHLGQAGEQHETQFKIIPSDKCVCTHQGVPTEDLGVNTNLQGRGFKEIRMSTPKKEVKPGMCGPPIPIKELKHAYGVTIVFHAYRTSHI